MLIPKIEVDATNMRLVFSADGIKYGDWIKSKDTMINHMNWEIVGSNGNHLGVADLETIERFYGVPIGC